jgi:MFS family permease
LEQREKLGFENVIRLGYVSLLTDISTEMVLGVLPFFIVQTLGATAAVLGLIEGSAEAVGYFFRVIAGILTDKFGKRKFLVVIGYGLSTVAKPFFAVTNTWGQALDVRVLDRVGKGTRTSPRDALISDSVDQARSGKAFGLHRSLDQVGAIVGPLVAFAALPLVGVRGIFWLSFVPAILAVFILAFFVKESRRGQRNSGLFENAQAVLTREFMLLLLVLGFFSVGAYDFSFILLKANSLGVPERDIPLVYATLNVATVMVGLPAGILADKIGKIRVLFLGYGVFAVTSIAGLFLNEQWSYAFLIAAMFGCYLAIYDTVQRALIPDFTRPELKGTAYGYYYLLIGGSSFVANSVFGALWTAWGAPVAFEFSVVMSALGLGVLFLFICRKPLRQKLSATER